MCFSGDNDQTQKQDRAADGVLDDFGMAARLVDCVFPRNAIEPNVTREGVKSPNPLPTSTEDRVSILYIAGAMV